MPATKKQIDFDQLEELCKMQCTGEEVAAVLKVDYDTLNARIKEEYGIGFSDYYEQKKDFGRASLRRRQFQQAETNPTMAIWLGKQYLDQKDKQEIDQKSTTTIVIEPPKFEE